MDGALGIIICNLKCKDGYEKFEIYIEEKHKFWTVLGVTIACVIGVCFLPPVVIMWIGIILLVASTIGVLWGIFGH